MWHVIRLTDKLQFLWRLGYHDLNLFINVSHTYITGQMHESRNGALQHYLPSRTGQRADSPI